jgi:cytochrome c-type biogenesis protein CcmH
MSLRRRRPLLRVAAAVIGAALVFAALDGVHHALAADEVTFSDAVVAEARRLEGRLYAPCCWKQTLDIHSSPLADQLRAEIRGRVQAGESLQAIEASLVAKYGDRVRALPEEGFMDRPAILAMGAVCAALLAFVYFGWRMTRRDTAAAPPPAPIAATTDEAALREQLADLD